MARLQQGSEGRLWLMGRGSRKEAGLPAWFTETIQYQVGKTGSALAAMRDSRANKIHNATTTTSYAIFNRRWAENSTGTQTQRQLSGLRQSDDREMWQQSNLALGARRTSSLRPLVGERNRVASCLEVMLSCGATRDHKVRFGG